MSPAPDYAELSQLIARAGFMARGGFHAQAGDGLPAGVASVVMIGNVGEQGFDLFRGSPEWGTSAHPMDRYTERVMASVAEGCGARVVYPQQGPPWWPFQRWAMRAEAVSVSPLRLLIHPQHGLWHAYRAALTFDVRVIGVPIQDPGERARKNPCARCRLRPCQSGCPVDAFDEHGFDPERCERHLRSVAGRHCLNEGCAARNACPAAPGTRYGSEQRQFHMRAFLGSLSVHLRQNDKSQSHE